MRPGPDPATVFRCERSRGSPLCGNRAASALVRDLRRREAGGGVRKTGSAPWWTWQEPHLGSHSPRDHWCSHNRTHTAPAWPPGPRWRLGGGPSWPPPKPVATMCMGV